VNWIQMGQDRVKWRAVLLDVMNHMVP